MCRALKRELWAKVKAGDMLIYASVYEGVFKAKVLEVDIRLLEVVATSTWSYPYGLTKDTGSVRVQFDSREEILNLADLCRYTDAVFRRLSYYWKAVEGLQADLDASKTAFQEQIAKATA